MSKRRIKFSKLGMAKYISHLDLLRTFTRSIMRSGLPVRYTNGFNPHQIISFSLPLSVGITSEAEYVDVDFEDSVSNKEIMEKLNLALPYDMRVLSVSMPKINANDICAAKYIITFSSVKFSKEDVDNFFNRIDIPVVKKTKKGEKEVNLKDYIKSYIVTECKEDVVELNVILSAGGSENIKPSILVDELLKYTGETEETLVYIHRKNIFYKSEKELKIYS